MTLLKFLHSWNAQLDKTVLTSFKVSVKLSDFYWSVGNLNGSSLFFSVWLLDLWLATSCFMASTYFWRSSKEEFLYLFYFSYSARIMSCLFFSNWASADEARLIGPLDIFKSSMSADKCLREIAEDWWFFFWMRPCAPSSSSFFFSNSFFCWTCLSFLSSSSFFS